MIITKGLDKIFRTEEIETSALKEINIHIKKSEFVAIMGPSGCGKSTLLNIIGLLDNPSAGQYSFNGVDLSMHSEKQRTKYRKGNIGFIFQSFNLIDELSVFENVELPLIYMGLSKSARKEAVNKVLKRMNIAHRATHCPQVVGHRHLTMHRDVQGGQFRTRGRVVYGH